MTAGDRKRKEILGGDRELGWIWLRHGAPPGGDRWRLTRLRAPPRDSLPRAMRRVEAGTQASGGLPSAGRGPAWGPSSSPPTGKAGPRCTREPGGGGLCFGRGGMGSGKGETDWRWGGGAGDRYIESQPRTPPPPAGFIDPPPAAAFVAAALPWPPGLLPRAQPHLRLGCVGKASFWGAPGFLGVSA